MTDDSRKSKKELIEELTRLRKRISELESVRQEDISHQPNNVYKTLSEISYNLVQNNKIDFDEIVKTIGLNTPFNRVFILSYKYKNKSVDVSSEWHVEGLEPFKNKFNNFSLVDFPWFNEILTSKKTIFYKDVNKLDSKLNEKKFLLQNKTKSFIAIPLFLRGDIYGILICSNSEIITKDLSDYKFLLTNLASLISSFITNKKLVEEVEENENILRHLMNTINVGIYLIRDGKFLYANKFGLEILGYTFEELKEMNIFNLISPEMKDKVINNHKRRIAGEDVENNYDFKIINKSGEEKWINLQADLFKFRGKDCVLTTILDITDKKNAFIKLEESEARFRGLYENSSIGIYRTTPEGEVILCNPTLLNMLGYESNEEISKLNLNKQGYYKAQRSEFLEFVKDKEVYFGLEQGWKRKDGKEIFIRESGRVVRDKNGEILYFEGIVEDITEAKKISKKLEEQNQRYKALFDTSPTGIVIEDKNGIIIDVNKKQLEICGYNKDELVGKHISILAAEKNYDIINENISKIISGINLHSTVEARRKDGSIIYVELHETRIPLSKNRYGILSITNDVTERVEYERTLLKTMKKAEASEKMKSEFLAQMSHEIRTPINTILSFTSLIKDTVKDKGVTEVDELFPVVENAGRRIIRTIGLILNMSEIQTGSYEPIFEELDIFEDIIDDFVIEYNLKAKEKGLKFKIESDTKPTKIKGDRYTVNQIFDNLLNNALKYTEKGFISVKVYSVKNKIVVDISDSGIGISEKYIPNLFKPFTQQEQGYTRRFEGNGLGLALVKHYCELNNISIDVISEVNKGTTFTLIFNNTIS